MATHAAQAKVFYSEKAYKQLNIFLKKTAPSAIFIIVDSNTQDQCLPLFLPLIETNTEIEIIEMDPGEEYKNIETCSGIWNVLSELGADRKSLVINLGGGVVTDLGGFIASTFKRGIQYINVPTTLLSMVDASVGGKTGVDLGNLKNQIGVISQPEMVLIDPGFLSTLPPEEMRSGLAEILKHGLIAKRAYWEKANDLKKLGLEDLRDLIMESVDIKTHIVTKDPREENLRKTLNFGHTFGHAIESYFLTHPEKNKVLHGEAVAAGMIIALFLSTKITNFPEKELESITQTILEFFPVIEIREEDFSKIIELLKFDKKNSHGNINFVLLEEIGVPIIDCKVPEDMLFESLGFYKNLKTR
ncbi:3-dehydroquinate synthase [Antarcticibacterium arcticum]|uniref:3-dehydroquinate synthase n=1 Tax=Antarcticibacterium arcticum TaxID=2585771 RepID=A0A5B8YL66_9FLAO|nr:3-dehydroquinate synthase [Antarcticibacterium arcticum]QED37066.1 3-dehydroquinate synthase [Antarcticibacterium arcticum]